VHAWLAENGIPKARCGYSAAKDWVNVKLNVADAEKLFDTEFSVFQHEDGTQLIRTLEWSIPASLHSHVSTIQPTNSFLRARPNAVHVRPYHIDSAGHFPWKSSPPPPTGNVSAVCNATQITPTCLRTLYGTIDYKPKVPGLNRVGLNDFLGEINNRSDTSIFLKTYRPDAASAAYTFKQISVAGGTLQQTPENETQLEAGTGLEGNLDIQTILGISYPTPATAYSTGGSPPFIPDAGEDTDTNEPYVSWLQYVQSQPDFLIPQVISTSYGDDEQTVPESYAKTACAGFAQLGARGVSIIFSSGDAGVGPDGACFSNDGKNKTEFIPAFPAGCPYVCFYSIVIHLLIIAGHGSRCNQRFQS
jgi:tripeptidyl-peptidase I